MRKPTIVCEDPDKVAVIDNIGSLPFILTADWSSGKLCIRVEVTPGSNPYPIEDFEVELLEKEPEEEDEEETGGEDG